MQRVLACSATHLRAGTIRTFAHVHQGPGCTVCASLVASTPSDEQPQQPSEEASTLSGMAEPPFTCHRTSQASATPLSSEALEASRLPSWVGDPQGIFVTVEGQRAQAMRQFALSFQRVPTHQNVARSPAVVGSDALEIEDAEFSLWRKFEGTDQPISDAEYDALATFLDKVRTRGEASCTSNHSTETFNVENDKQRRFRQTLLELQRILTQTLGAPDQFFLCCGTALGAIREGRFIEHDDDIDIGISFNELVRRGLDPSNVVVNLLAELGTRTEFVCIDVLGEVDFGFELRLKHMGTGVMADINMYYEETSAENDDHFVWCATHYEDSHGRKHGMYRYRHAPFFNELKRLDFAGGTFMVPPERYLEEYFGCDWKTPKKFSYTEGLAWEYKNIIAE